MGNAVRPGGIRIEGLPQIYNKVLFLDLEPVEGEYEPLVKYIVLEQCGAAVDKRGQRLVLVKCTDLK